MRKLMAMIAIVFMSVGATKSWAIVGLGDLSFDGSLEVRGNSAKNETDFNDTTNDHRGNTATRVRLGINSQVTEHVMGRIELARTPASAGAAALYGGAGKPTSVHGETTNFVLHNAYVTLQNIWGMDWRLGRQYVGETGDLVWHIGPKSDDSLTITSIDGLGAECAAGADKKGNVWDKLHLVLFTGKLVETAANPATTDATSSGDVNLSNIELQIHDVIPNGRIRTALLLGDASNTSAAGDNNHLKIFRLGANGAVADNMVTYRAEYLQNFGQFNGAGATSDLKYKGNAMDLGVGVNSPSNGKSTPLLGGWLNFVRASGDDNADNDDKSFHDFSTLGTNSSDRYFGEIYGRSNTLGGGTPSGQGLDTGLQGPGLTVLNLGVQVNPPFGEGKYWARADYYNLRTSKDVTLGGGRTSKSIGNEVDLTLGYNHSENIGFEGGYAWLTPNDVLTGGGGAKDDAVQKLFARANIKWGGENK